MDDQNKIVLPEEPAELKQTIEQEPVKEVSTPVVEEQEQEQTQEQVQEPEPQQEQNKGASQRIKELVKENKSLAQRLAEVTQQPVIPNQYQPYVPQVKPGEELTIEQYQTDIAKTADAKIELRLAQERAVNRINNEALDVVRKYPELDPTSDKFDPDLSEAVVQATEASINANPYTASVAKVVDTLMKPYQKVATRKVSEAQQQVAKQVNDAAMRPTSVRQPEKPAQEKTLAELEKELGIVNS